MKKLIKYFKSDIVSLVLLIMSISAVIGYFNTGKNLTYALAIFALYIVGSVWEKGRFLDAIKYYGEKHPNMTISEMLLEMNIISMFKRKISKLHWFHKMAAIIILVGGIAVIGAMVYYLAFAP